MSQFDLRPAVAVTVVEERPRHLLIEEWDFVSLPARELLISAGVVPGNVFRRLANYFETSGANELLHVTGTILTPLAQMDDFPFTFAAVFRFLARGRVWVAEHRSRDLAATKRGYPFRRLPGEEPIEARPRGRPALPRKGNAKRQRSYGSYHLERGPHAASSYVTLLKEYRE